MNGQAKTIPIPTKLFNALINAQRNWEKFNDELEDFLVSSDDRFVKKMEQARQEDLEGRTRDLSELEKDLGQSLKEVKEGKVIGPFDEAEDLMNSLSA